MADIFRGGICTTAYAKFRLNHPDWIFDSIFDYCKGGSFQLAVDVGCGSGQSSNQICCHFQSVVGMDISEDQIKAAKSKHENITFRVGKAEDLSFLEDETVDLVTVGASLHWFDIPKFFMETKRVLKPGGVLAVYSYVLPNADCPFVKTFFDEFITYLDSRTKQVWEHFKNLEFPFNDLKRLEYVHTVETSVDNFLGFLPSLSAWQTFVAQNPDAGTKLERKLKEFYFDDRSGELRNMKLFYDYFLILARK
ncbi:hypothetical protein ACJMK2_013920 [Sinanodonta woodiana]|uniref:Methyltransferase type 11 domain-containing protein n=1 Tax=Sinanodonta woodiana TaxID=1069815 RepID=A0ABD3UYY6_SINWO